MVKEYIIKVS
jgi:hypothetical protein